MATFAAASACQRRGSCTSSASAGRRCGKPSISWSGKTWSSVRPNSGYSAANFDIEAVCNLLVVLEGLDAIAAELAANVASDADLERLSGVMSEIEALDSVHTR